MADVMMDLSETVSDARGVFHARAMARERRDGSWQAWLEVVRLPRQLERWDFQRVTCRVRL